MAITTIWCLLANRRKVKSVSEVQGIHVSITLKTSKFMGLEKELALEASIMQFPKGPRHARTQPKIDGTPPPWVFRGDALKQSDRDHTV